MRRLQNDGRIKIGVIVVTGVLLLLLIAGGAAAATVVSDDTYRLPAAETIDDNLYVAGGEIIIDGTVTGDVVAFGGYIELNGSIGGDVLAMGGAIVVNGPVAGDVRIAGGGLTLNGSIGGDLLSAGGGGAFPGGMTVPMQIDERQVQQGTVLSASASVGKDAMMAGGSGVIAGSIAGDLWAAMGSVTLDGAVGGDANLAGGTITVSDAASVGGTLYYTTDNNSAPEIPPGVAGSVERVVVEAPTAAREPSPAERLLFWTISVVRTLIGVLVLGWLVLRLLPGFTARTLGEMERNAVLAIAAGLIFAVAAVPVVLVLMGLAWLFWGFVAGGMMTGFLLVGLLGVLWFASPVFAGIWLGKRLLRRERSEVLSMLVGVLVVTLIIRAAEWLPIVGGAVGWLLQLACFAYAAGAMILALRRRDAAPSVPAAHTGPPL